MTQSGNQFHCQQVACAGQECWGWTRCAHEDRREGWSPHLSHLDLPPPRWSHPLSPHGLSRYPAVQYLLQGGRRLSLGAILMNACNVKSSIVAPALAFVF